MALSVLILAAGKGTRMNSNSPKVLHHVGNIPMIYYSINLAIKAKAKNIGIVISKDATEIKNFIKSLSINIKLFVQSNQLGTGHAILSAKEFETKSEDLIILYGDCPLITVDTIKKLINTKKKGADLSVLGFLSNNQKEYGRMVVDKNNNLSRIIEFKDADKNEKDIKFCNSGVIISKAKILFSLLNQISNNNSAEEFYLTDIVSLANKQGLIVKSVYCNEAEAQGVNNRQDLSEVELEFQKNEMPKEIYEKSKKQFLDRFEKLNWEEYHDKLPFNTSALSLYEWSPIAEELKSLDKQIVLNSMILKWDNVKKEFIQLINF